MTTTSGLVEATRRHLLSGTRETLNQSAALTSSATSFTLSRTLANVAAGSVLSVGLESLYVWSVTDGPGKVVEVQRGYEGSTPASHALGDLVRVNPPHTDFAILQALNAEVASLSGAGLFRMRTLDFTTSAAGVRAYDLAADVVSLYDLRVDSDSTGNEWPRVHSYALMQGSLAGEFPSGYALRLDEAVPGGRPARLWYRAALGSLSTLADDVETTTGLLPSAHDLPSIGAAWRLTLPAEVARNQTQRQGDSRRAEEVPPGAKVRSAAGLAEMRRQRLHEEIANLTRRWPLRSTR